MHWFSHLLIETERKLHIVDIVVNFTFNSNIYCLKPHYKNISTTHYHYLVEFSTSLMTSQHSYFTWYACKVCLLLKPLSNILFKKMYFVLRIRLTRYISMKSLWILDFFLTIPNETNIITTHCGDNFTFTRSIVLN